VFKKGVSPSFYLKDGGWEKIEVGIGGYAIINPKMRNSLTITSFILIAIGTAGLLLNEFTWEHSTTCAIIFAILNLLGLISLAITHFSRGKEIT
jgi:hypothetical protein